MHIFINKMGAGTAPSYDVNWVEFREQHDHPATKKSTICMPNLHRLGATKV